jgi:hypothetical protein
MFPYLVWLPGVIRIRRRVLICSSGIASKETVLRVHLAKAFGDKPAALDAAIRLLETGTETSRRSRGEIMEAAGTEARRPIFIEKNWWRRRELNPRPRIRRRRPATCVSPFEMSRPAENGANLPGRHLRCVSPGRLRAERTSQPAK